MIVATEIDLRCGMLTRDDEARKERLMAARVERGFKSARDAATQLGLTESTYRSHENGNRAITRSAAAQYAQKLNIDYRWLWEGKGDLAKSSLHGIKASNDGLSPNAALPPIQLTGSAVLLPVRGRGQGGPGGEIVLDGSIEQRLPGPSSLSEVDGAYGLEVVGDSMEHRFFPREIVWVDPRRSVHRDDYAVFQVRMPNGELHAFIKRFVRYSDGHVIACQHNPELELRWKLADVEAIHLIVATGVR